ncbi:MAG: fumarylacetoacetate hydrolase family protein [Micrococcus sp.]|nr:fumarylacetoacetate hydrolase family protein [Micrococcus sp.]
MKLATFRLPSDDAAYPGNTFAALITATHPDDDQVALEAVALEDVTDVGDFLSLTPHEQQERVDEAVAQAQEDPERVLDATALMYESLVPFPTKIYCVGLNYRDHIEETGLEAPEHPTLFAKFAQSLTGALDGIEVPGEDHRLDYEGELCVVIGEPGRRIAEADAHEHIAGYAVANDVSVRGFQGRTSEWLQGKVWDASTPVGPWLVSADEFDAKKAMLTTTVNGERRQHSRALDVVFTPEKIVSYVSQMTTLHPGDLILLGTPSGVALGRKGEDGRRPWLTSGDVVEVEITGLGRQHTEVL